LFQQFPVQSVTLTEVEAKYPEDNHQSVSQERKEINPSAVFV